jgi:hypothetical protein
VLRQRFGHPYRIFNLYQFQLEAHRPTTPRYWLNVGPIWQRQAMNLVAVLIIPHTDLMIDASLQDLDPLFGAYANLQHLQVLLEHQAWVKSQTWTSAAPDREPDPCNG